MDQLQVAFAAKRTSEPNKVAEKKSSKIVLAAAKPGLVNKKKRSLTNAKSSSQATFQNGKTITGKSIHLHPVKNRNTNMQKISKCMLHVVVRNIRRVLTPCADLQLV